MGRNRMWCWVVSLHIVLTRKPGVSMKITRYIEFKPTVQDSIIGPAGWTILLVALGWPYGSDPVDDYWPIARVGGAIFLIISIHSSFTFNVRQWRADRLRAFIEKDNRRFEGRLRMSVGRPPDLPTLLSRSKTDFAKRISEAKRDSEKLP